mmetsp:Transcript_15538/g.50982  ORF Transcript_15538/g.50982 Transcript_15538/m.50982 type:complete len:351 (-) Transcript_15538:319-1371(-)
MSKSSFLETGVFFKAEGPTPPSAHCPCPESPESLPPSPVGPEARAAVDATAPPACIAGTGCPNLACSAVTLCCSTSICSYSAAVLKSLSEHSVSLRAPEIVLVCGSWCPESVVARRARFLPFPPFVFTPPARWPPPPRLVSSKRGCATNTGDGGGGALASRVRLRFILFAFSEATVSETLDLGSDALGSEFGVCFCFSSSAWSFSASASAPPPVFSSRRSFARSIPTSMRSYRPICPLTSFMRSSSHRHCHSTSFRYCFHPASRAGAFPLPPGPFASFPGSFPSPASPSPSPAFSAFLAKSCEVPCLGSPAPLLSPGLVGSDPPSEPRGALVACSPSSSTCRSTASPVSV